MPPSSAPARLGDAAGTLRLLAYLAAAVTLAVLDHRGGWMHRLREQAGIVAEPVRAVAGLPGRLAETTVDNVATVSQLAQRNRDLRRELLVSQARIARLSTVIADNSRLRALLDAAQRGGLDVQLAPILDVDLDPTRQRLVLDAGTRDGVREGQSVIDARGLLGQVTRAGALHSDVLLITDPDHAVPVAIARNGVRLVAYGSGRADQLSLASIPLSSDIRVGDLVVTSGLGGRFPPGFPVGRIVALRPDESRAFLEGDVRPAAQLDRGREVLLLRSNRVTLPLPPPPPASVAGMPGEGLSVGLGTSTAPAGSTTPSTGSGPTPAAPRATGSSPAPVLVPVQSTLPRAPASDASRGRGPSPAGTARSPATPQRGDASPVSAATETGRRLPANSPPSDATPATAMPPPAQERR